MSEINHRTPQESAEYLANSLNTNTAALNKVRKRYRLTLALIAIVVVTLLAVVKFNYDGEVSRCNVGNDLRVEQNAKWDSIIEFLEANGTGDTPEEQEFLAILDKDLVLRNCSDINLLGR